MITIDLTGKLFGRLRVVARDPDLYAMWHVVCSGCTGTLRVPYHHLVPGEHATAPTSCRWCAVPARADKAARKGWVARLGKPARDSRREVRREPQNIDRRL